MCAEPSYWGEASRDRWRRGFSAPLLADGAVLCEGAMTHQYVDGRRRVLLPGHDLIGSTRPFLETRVLRRVTALENVSVVRGRADGLRFGADSRRPGVAGAGGPAGPGVGADADRPGLRHRPSGYRAAQWYGAMLNRATTTDAEVNRRFLDVVNMRARPRLLTRPGTAVRVARALWAARGR